MTAQEIIEKLKAEVERLKGICTAQIKANPGQTFPFVMEMTGYDKLLAKLSDLEKSEKPMELDFEQELYKHFGQVKDFTLGMRIGQYFYELGCRRTAEKYDEIEYERQRASGSSEIPKDLEEAAKEYCPDYAYPFSPAILKTIIREAFIAGAKWQEEQDLKYISEIHRNGYNLCKEQMMKEAVEWDYTLEDGRIEFEGDPLPCLNPILNLPYPKFKPGQKVKVIICKKED